MRTPLEIELLIHYYVSAVDFPNLDAPAIKDAIESFLVKGLLFRSTGEVKYVANYVALEPYIIALRSVPLPTQKWSV